MSAISRGPSKTQTIRLRDGDTCWICDAAIDFDLPREHDEAATLDHVVSRYHGGANANDNLRLAHRVCNEARGRWQHQNGVLVA